MIQGAVHADSDITVEIDLFSMTELSEQIYFRGSLWIMSPMWSGDFLLDKLIIERAQRVNRLRMAREEERSQKHLFFFCKLEMASIAFDLAMKMKRNETLIKLTLWPVALGCCLWCTGSHANYLIKQDVRGTFWILKRMKKPSSFDFPQVFQTCCLFFKSWKMPCENCIGWSKALEILDQVQSWVEQLAWDHYTRGATFCHWKIWPTPNDSLLQEELAIRHRLDRYVSGL